MTAVNRLLPGRDNRRRVWIGVLLALMFVTTGCDDPYSRTRIARREDHIRQFGDDVRGSEARHAERLREEGETFNRWWARDRDRFNRRWPTIGDYIW